MIVGRPDTRQFPYFQKGSRFAYRAGRYIDTGEPFKGFTDCFFLFRLNRFNGFVAKFELQVAFGGRIVYPKPPDLHKVLGQNVLAETPQDLCAIERDRLWGGLPPVIYGNKSYLSGRYTKNIGFTGW